jgi:homoserine kinase type II
VRARNGDALGELAGRPAAFVSFLDGMWVRRPKTEHCAAVGKALAELHQAGEGFPLVRENALSVAGWRPIFEACRSGADGVSPGLQGEIAAELDALEAAWPAALPAGIIHADLFPDNVFFLGGRLSGLIDFYFACNDMFAYDVSVVLNSWCFEPDLSFNATKGQAMLSAYAAVRPFTEAELAALPLLARGSALRFLLSRLYDWLNVPPGALVTPKNPVEYLRKMRFHRSVASVAAYGFHP